MKIYTIIRSDKQYISYCNDLEKMTKDYQINSNEGLLDMIDTLTLLIEKYDEEHSKSEDVDPIVLLKCLMNENRLNQKDLAELLQISKGHLSDILNYKKGLSKNVIRILAERFKVRQDALNKPYTLSVEHNKNYPDAEMKKRKSLLKLK
ncbi:MAG: helix-turn-helix domain-containing protein [Cyclobacteriaceae bacterium]|nr:helix-turn-helix domain-containing protein [Cyclobacteriaceae bacterium]